jgi:hypothetical protein
MNTKVLMTASAIIMGLTGIALSFMPQEIAGQLSLSAPSSIETLILQLLGAVYFSFAMLNWTARANLIGGIYGRPIAIGNLTHFVIGALALMKGYVGTKDSVVLVVAIIYAVFAVCFAIVFFTHPLPEKTSSGNS